MALDFGFVPTGGCCACRFGLLGKKPLPTCGDKPDDDDWD